MTRWLQEAKRAEKMERAKADPNAQIEFIAEFMWHAYTNRISGQAHSEPWDDVDDQTAKIYLNHASAAMRAMRMLRGQIARGGRKPKPVTIRGVEYPSASKAAESLGVSVHTVKSARSHGTLDRVGLGPRRSGTDALAKRAEKNRAQIHFEGSVFDGWKQATHITGLSRNTLTRKGAQVSRKTDDA